MHLPTEVTKIQGLQRNAVITRTLLQRTYDFYHLKKPTFGPHNIQIRGSLHSLLLFSNSPDVKWKKKKKTRKKKVLRGWNECISIGKRKEHCQLKYSFITKFRVKRYTQYPARNRGDGRHYLEEEKNSLWKQVFGKPRVEDHAVGSMKLDVPGSLDKTKSDRKGTNSPSVQFHQVAIQMLSQMSDAITEKAVQQFCNGF